MEQHQPFLHAPPSNILILPSFLKIASCVLTTCCDLRTEQLHPDCHQADPGPLAPAFPLFCPHSPHLHSTSLTPFFSLFQTVIYLKKIYGVSPLSQKNAPAVVLAGHWERKRWISDHRRLPGGGGICTGHWRAEINVDEQHPARLALVMMQPQF